MATAEELLQTLNSETEEHIVIGSDRRITVPASLKRIAVQFDHNIETVTFDCPRYWDGLDMSNMAVYINYMRSDKFADSYPVGAVTIDDVDPSIMHFDWTISRNVTSIDGGIVFLVCVKNTDADGLEINHWNSELCKDLTVSPGMENDEQFIDYQYDLVTQLLLEVESLREEVENIEMTGDGRPEIYVGSGDMPEGYVLQINPDGDEVFDVDQTYTPESENAQSGKAVAEALEPFNRQYELIETITIAEDGISTITRNTEPNGNAYSFKDVFINFSWKTEDTKKWILLEISADGKKTDAFRDLYQITTGGTSWMRTLSCCGHRLFLLSERSSNTGYASNSAQIPIRYFDSNKPIDAIKIQYQEAMPTGTTIEIWGVRA